MDEKELDKMAKDIEPIEEPKDNAAPESPTGFVEDKETYVKPDGETTTTPVRSPNVIKEESSKGKWIFRSLATILILGLGGATAWAYTDAQNVRNELQSLKTGLEAARSDAAKLRADVANVKQDTSKIAATEVTTQELLDGLVDATQDADTTQATVATPGKVQGDFTSVYIRDKQSPGGFIHIFKKYNGLLVEIERYLSEENALSKQQADTLKTKYGFDAAKYGIKVE